MGFYHICYQLMCGFCYFLPACLAFLCLFPASQLPPPNIHPRCWVPPHQRHLGHCASPALQSCPLVAGLDPAWMGCLLEGIPVARKLIQWEHLAAVITSSETPLQLLNMLIEMVKSTDKRVLGNLSTSQPNLPPPDSHLGVHSVVLFGSHSWEAHPWLGKQPDEVVTPLSQSWELNIGFFDPKDGQIQLHLRVLCCALQGTAAWECTTGSSALTPSPTAVGA